jgi:CheY-like chemotaxis protein/HPt (histidine-containing phosphotransfer) domain-containing protein
MMLSSSGRHEDVERCRELGIAACLTKPISASDLLDAIRHAIDPTLPAASAAQPVTAPQNRRAAQARKILLAEDNVVNQRVAVGLLNRRGHQVTVVANGREAVEAVAQETFDLVLMDLQMPVMGGLEATAAIRAHEAVSGKHVWIVAMTAHVMPGDKERCLASGMDGYLGKPIDPKALFAEVEEGLSHPSPAASPLRAKANGIDHAELLGRLYGDEQLADEVVRLFIGECATMVDAVGTALAVRDVDLVRRAAHTLKGSASTAAAHGVADAARTIERLAADGQLDALDAAWTQLSKEATLLLRTAPASNALSKETPCEP